MGRRKTTDEYKKQLYEINPYVEVIGDYINNRVNILCKCKKHNITWMANPRSLLNGSGCIYCGKEKVHNALSISHENFIDKMSVVNPSIEVLEKYYNNHTNILCKCKKCGYEFRATPHNLLDSLTTCKKCYGTVLRTTESFKEEMFLLNKDIEIIGDYVNSKTKIKCKCKKCNNIWETTPDVLTRGFGCPSCSESKGESKINNFLVNNSICFSSQYKYDGLVGVGKRQLSYDFYLPDYNLLIEYQGLQHEKPIEWFGGKKHFEIQQEHDKRKREYAKEHNIELLEIWYWDFDNIENILDRKLNINSNRKSA